MKAHRGTGVMPRLTAQPSINPNPNIAVDPAFLVGKHHLSHRAQMHCCQDNQYSNGNKRLYCPNTSPTIEVREVQSGNVSLSEHIWEQFAIRRLDSLWSLKKTTQAMRLVNRSTVALRGLCPWTRHLTLYPWRPKRSSLSTNYLSKKEQCSAAGEGNFCS